MKRVVAGLALLSWISAAGFGCNRIAWDPRPPADAKSVVFISIDTLRADRVGVYGASFAKTPTLDALASGGVRFETAISATPMTLPSHTTMFTGQDAPEHGVRHNGTFKLGEEAETLAERFRAGGWETGAFVGAVVLKARYGLDQGFEHYGDDIQGEKSAPGGFVERRAAEVVDAALAWTRSIDGPYFLFVHLYDPHMDHRAPPEYAAQFPDRPYDAEIAYVDAEVGRLLDSLRSEGRLDRSLVVLTSDHGESLGEHGERTHSSSLHDAVLRVPLILSGSEVPAGRVVSGVVRLKDVAPTVLAQVGLDALPDASGQDLSRHFAAGVESEGRTAYSETLATMLDNGWAPLHSIRTDEWFYVRSPRPELYAMAADPRQLENLIESAPDRAREPHHRLDGLVDETLANERNGITLEVDDDTRAQLLALGYAIADGPVVQTGIDPKDGRRYLPILHRAMGAYEAGNLPMAEQLFLEVAKKLPGSGRSHSQLASIYYHDGRWERALRHIELAISFESRSPLHHAVRAEILLALGRRDEARASYQNAIALDPDAPWSKVGLLWEALDQGDHELAQRWSREAMDDDPSNTGVYLRVASLWAEYQDYPEAARVLEEALRRAPDSGFTHMRLAIEYARTSRPEQALAERALAGPLATSERLGTVLGRSFASVRDFDRAEEQLRAVLAEHPDSKFATESMSLVHAWREKLAMPVSG